MRDVGAQADSQTSLMSFAFGGGARYVLASIWRATDDATRELMIVFYRKLGDGMEPEVALQQAKRAVAAATDVHPYYFANFILTARSLAAACQRAPNGAISR